MPNLNPNLNAGNIYVKTNGGRGVYLWTSDKGTQLPIILQAALRRGRAQWGNSAGLARIIFAEMVQEDPMGLNKFGISTEIGDNNNYILAVDDQTEKIGLFEERGSNIMTYTFEQFINISNPTWRNVATSNYSHYEGYGTNRRRTDPYPME